MIDYSITGSLICYMIDYSITGSLNSYMIDYSITGLLISYMMISYMMYYIDPVDECIMAHQSLDQPYYVHNTHITSSRLAAETL